MTAADLQAEAAQALAETARFELLTNQAETTGRVFDHNQPLPPLRNHCTHREWETQEPTHETP